MDIQLGALGFEQARLERKLNEKKLLVGNKAERLMELARLFRLFCASVVPQQPSAGEHLCPVRPRRAAHGYLGNTGAAHTGALGLRAAVPQAGTSGAAPDGRTAHRRQRPGDVSPDADDDSADEVHIIRIVMRDAWALCVHHISD